MLIMTEMETGIMDKKLIEPDEDELSGKCYFAGHKDEYGEEYGDEVLSAGWLPQPDSALMPSLALGLQVASPLEAKLRKQTEDAEAFMRAVYLSQE